MKDNLTPVDAFFEANHPDLTQLGARLRALRQRARLTQAELAHRAGLHRGTIADVERGRRSNIWFSTARRLATALGLESPQPLLSDIGVNADLCAQNAVLTSSSIQNPIQGAGEPKESRQ